jgi:hypothetical protein
MRNIKSFENFSSENMSNNTREKMTDYLMSCGYTEEECNSMDLEEMSQVCDGCGMNDVNEARKYTRRKKTAQSQKAQSQKAQSQKAQSKDEVKTFSQVQSQKSKSAQKGAQEMSYKESGLKHPGKADRNKDGKISSWEKATGKAIQKSIQNKKEVKTPKKTTKRK